jgi:glycerol uptake facilitator protein
MGSHRSDRPVQEERRSVSIFGAETIGTAILILLGDGVVAGVLLNRSKAQNAGWVVITFGWGLAVAMAVFAVFQFSGAHINPAVTLGTAVIGNTDWGDVPAYLGGQFVGAFIGATLVYLAYLPHWADTEDPGLKLAVFSTGPAIRNYAMNLARDLGPRIMHAILPIAGKGPSDWGYAWVPVVGPIIGGILGALAFDAFFPG